jgi:hypothetical protein
MVGAAAMPSTSIIAARAAIRSIIGIVQAGGGAVSRIQDGKRVRVKVSGCTKYEIKGRLKVLHEEIDRGVEPSASYEMADPLTDWLEHGLDGRSPKTMSTYREVTAPCCR